MKGKDIHDFEEAHGKPKIKQLEEALAQEKTKIENLMAHKKRITIDPQSDNTIFFAITSDRHIGSLYHNGEALEAFYEYCQKEGVQIVFDAGDMVDGHRVYKGHEFELRDLGFDRQLERITKESPRQINTKFITGNHDASFKHLAGVEIGNQISALVPEYEYLGDTTARYKWITPNGEFILDLLHPGGGTAYALSYKPQKIVDALEGGTKPDMLAIGHFHKAEVMPTYRNVCTIQAGTFQTQTPFMSRQGIQAHVGGWLVQVTIGRNKANKIISPRFVAFY
jgi:hypothetical protein